MSSRKARDLYLQAFTQVFTDIVVGDADDALSYYKRLSNVISDSYNERANGDHERIQSIIKEFTFVIFMATLYTLCYTVYLSNNPAGQYLVQTVYTGGDEELFQIAHQYDKTLDIELVETDFEDYVWTRVGNIISQSTIKLSFFPELYERAFEESLNEVDTVFQNKHDDQGEFSVETYLNTYYDENMPADLNKVNSIFNVGLRFMDADFKNEDPENDNNEVNRECVAKILAKYKLVGWVYSNLPVGCQVIGILPILHVFVYRSIEKLARENV